MFRAAESQKSWMFSHNSLPNSETFFWTPKNYTADFWAFRKLCNQKVNLFDGKSLFTQLSASSRPPSASLHLCWLTRWAASQQTSKLSFDVYQRKKDPVDGEEVGCLFFSFVTATARMEISGLIFCIFLSRDSCEIPLKDTRRDAARSPLRFLGCFFYYWLKFGVVGKGTVLCLLREYICRALAGAVIK